MTTKNIRYHNRVNTPTNLYSYFAGTSQRYNNVMEESVEARDRRIFGGDEDETQSAMELRGPMLDVVLGLFNGIDYDDSLC